MNDLYPAHGDALAAIHGHVESEPKDNQCPYVEVLKIISAESIVDGYFIPGMSWVIDPIELSSYTWS